MKKGINHWAFPAGMPVKEVINLSAQYGFQGIELCPEEEGEISLYQGEEKWKEIKTLAEDKGIEIRSLATGLLWKYNLASPEKETREKAKEVVKRLVNIATKLQAKSILVIPGYVNIPWDLDSPVIPYPVAWEKAEESLRDLASVAEGAKVYLGIENVWNKFLLSPLEFRYFIDKINSPYVKVHFDTANVLVSGYPEQWISILGERIVTVHAKDFRLAVGNVNGFCIPLEGDVNWPEVMKSLEVTGYNDYLIAEVIPPYRYSVEALLANVSFNLDCIINSSKLL